MKYYKVLDENLRSFLNINRIQYKVGEWVKAPSNTRLFVFDNLYNAQKFNTIYPIFECEIIGGIKGYPEVYYLDHTQYWDKFNARVAKKKKFHVKDCPEFTNLKIIDSVLCKAVKLTTKVEKFIPALHVKYVGILEDLLQNPLKLQINGLCWYLKEETNNDASYEFVSNIINAFYPSFYQDLSNFKSNIYSYQRMNPPRIKLANIIIEKIKNGETILV